MKNEILVAKKVLSEYKHEKNFEKKVKLSSVYNFQHKEIRNDKRIANFCKIVKDSIDSLPDVYQREILNLSYIDYHKYNSEYIADYLNISRRTLFYIKKRALMNFAEVCPLIELYIKNHNLLRLWFFIYKKLK